MEAKARVKNVSIEIGDDSVDVTLHLFGRHLHDIEQLYEKDLRLNLVQWREKRSRDANAYFYVLVGKLADVMNVSKAYISDGSNIYFTGVNKVKESGFLPSSVSCCCRGIKYKSHRGYIWRYADE